MMCAGILTVLIEVSGTGEISEHRTTEGGEFFK